MKIVLICILVSLANFLYSQTADVDTACAPIAITFTPPAGHTSWFWDFKDKGSTSNLESPVHIFTNADEYHVEFRESQNGPIIGTILIVIYDKPVLTISTLPQFGCRPLTVAFNDLTVYKSGITPKSWLWVFGDGGAAMLKSPTYTYLNAGIVTPSLEVKTNLKGCDVTQAFPDDVTIFDLPKPSFLTNPEPPFACNPPLEVSFNNTSKGVEPLSYQWNFGNAGTSILKSPPPVNYTNKGDYYLSLNATDKNGCKGIFKDTVKIGTNLICLNIKDTICFMDTLFIKNCSPIGFHSWDLGPNAETKTTKERNPKVLFMEPGLQEIHYKLTIPSLECELDSVIKVYVQKPEPYISSVIPSHCEAPITIHYYSSPDDYLSYHWIFGIYEESTEGDPIFIYPEDPDNFSIFGERYLNVQLDIITPAGCPATIYKTDTLYLLTAAIKADTLEGQAPLKVHFADISYSAPKQPIISWRWIFGDGKELITNTMQHPVHFYDSCGIYYPYLIIENSLGCRDTSYELEISVQDSLCDGSSPGGGGPGIPNPTCTFDFYISDHEICREDTVWLYPNDCLSNYEVRFTSDGNRLFHCPDMDSIPWTFNHEPGYHSITCTVLGKTGKIYTLTKIDSIFVKGPYARPNYMTNCIDPLSVMFIDSSLNTTSILWELPGGKTYTDKIFTHKFDSTGDYLVFLTAFNDIDGCAPHKDSVWVHPRQLKSVFNLEKDQYCTGDTIKLNGVSSIDVNSVCYKGYTWNFPDEFRPLTSGSPLQTVIFKTPGKKSILLEVTDINGCTNTSKKDIQVHEVKADFIKLDKICLPKTISLKDKSTFNVDPIISWSWQVTPGTSIIVAPEQNPTIQIPETAYLPGTKVFIKLTVKNSMGCTSTTIDTFAIYKPFSEIVVALLDTILCTGEPIDISATDFTNEGSFLKYNWDFGNSATSTNQTNKISYITDGIYQVSLIYTEASSGCTDTTYQNLHVQASPVADFSTSTDSLIVLCEPTNVFFQNESTSKDSITYQWDFGNNLYSVLQNPGIVYQKGIYTASLITTTIAGCADTAYQSFQVHGPKGDFDFDKSQICVGDFLTLTLKDTTDIGIWTWDFGDGIIEKGTNPVKHQYVNLPPTLSTVAKLVLADITGTCKATVEKPVPVINIIADFDALTEDSVYCLGAIVQLNNKSINADSYHWDYNINETSSQTSPSFNLDQAGKFDIQLIAYNTVAGCNDTITKQIEVKPFILPILFGDTICLGDTAHIGSFKDGNGITWDWSPKTDVLKANSYQTGVLAKATTTYTVKAVQQPGCEATGEAEVIVIQPYTGIPLNWDTTVVNGAGIKLKIPYLDPSYSYEWIPATGLSCNLCPNPIFVADSSIVYKLIISDDSGCFNTEIRFNILVNPDKIDIPDVFTPNGDNRNDYFQIYVEHGGIGDIGIIQFKVYSRWGQKVYDNGDINKGWDGTFKGKPCPSDVYVYVIEVGYFNGRQETYRGEITLVR